MHSVVTSLIALIHLAPSLSQDARDLTHIMCFTFCINLTRTYYLHPIGKKMRPEKLSNSHTIAQLGDGKIWIKI